GNVQPACLVGTSTSSWSTNGLCLMPSINFAGEVFGLALLKDYTISMHKITGKPHCSPETAFLCEFIHSGRSTIGVIRNLFFKTDIFICFKQVPFFSYSCISLCRHVFSKS